MISKHAVHKQLIGELRDQIKKHTGGRMTASEEESTTGPGGNNADTHAPESDEPDGDELGGGRPAGSHDESDSDEPSDMTPEDAGDVEEAVASCKACGADVASKFCGECGTPRGGGEEAEAEFED
jgi:hypothetical protein